MIHQMEETENVYGKFKMRENNSVSKITQFVKREN